MRKSRPTALDRELADVWRKLQPGVYQVTVSVNVLPRLSFLEPAELKTEGGFRITLGDRRINVVPTYPL